MLCQYWALNDPFSLQAITDHCDATEETPVLFSRLKNAQKLLLPLGVSGPLSDTWFFGPTRISLLNGISIGSFLQGSQTWQTDQPYYSVCSNKPLSVANAALCANNSWTWSKWTQLNVSKPVAPSVSSSICFVSSTPCTECLPSQAWTGITVCVVNIELWRAGSPVSMSVHSVCCAHRALTRWQPGLNVCDEFYQRFAVPAARHQTAHVMTNHSVFTGITTHLYRWLCLVWLQATCFICTKQ